MSLGFGAISESAIAAAADASDGGGDGLALEARLGTRAVSSGASTFATGLSAREHIAVGARPGAGYWAAIDARGRAGFVARPAPGLSTSITGRGMGRSTARVYHSLHTDLTGRMTISGRGETAPSLAVALQILARAAGMGWAVSAGHAALFAVGRALTAARGIITGPGALSARAMARASFRATTSASVAISGQAKGAARSAGLLDAAASLSARSIASIVSSAYGSISLALSASGMAVSGVAASMRALLALTALSSARSRGQSVWVPFAALSGFVRAFARTLAGVTLVGATVPIRVEDAITLFASHRRKAVLATHKVKSVKASTRWRAGPRRIGKMKRFSIKLIDEVWLVSVDWVDELPAGVTVTEGAVTIDIHPDSIVTDAGKDSLLGSVDHTDTKIAAMVKAGGVAQCRYVLSFAASFSDGQKDIEQVELPVLALQP